MCQSCANGGDPLACWLVRVSTPGQKDLSPETQLAAIPWLEAQGYKVPEKYIINIVWASQELLDSPAIDQKLIPWIKNEEIHAIGMLHSDRLACSPGTAGYLYELCQKHHVKLLAQIAPFQEGSSGEIMAMLADKSKRDAVVENRPRIKKGMGDRAILHGLPITGKPPYGYQIRYETRQVGGKVHLTPLAFEPDPATYPIAQRIFRLALEGVSVRGICRQLVAEGIKAPRGGNAWGTNTLLKILENPIYQGQYYALRHESIEPKKRGKPGETFGHSSHRTRDREEWHRLDFPIECPIISEQEYEVIKERLKHNKDMASCQRTTRRFYLLRVMIFCAEDGRRYVGYGGSRGDYYYICSRKYRTDQGIPQCPSPRLSGPEIEAYVWGKVYEVLSNPRTWWAMMERQKQGTTGGKDAIREDIRRYERKLQTVDSKEAELVGYKLSGDVSEEAFKRVSALLRAERTHYREEIDRLNARLETLNQAAKAIEALEALRDRIIGRLDSPTLEDKRWILERLYTRVTIKEGQEPDIEIGVPKEVKEAFESSATDHNSQV